MTNEANMPELRFPGFNGKWEIKKLKDIGDIITGKTPSTSNPKFYNGNYPFVSPLDIQNHRFIKKTNKTLSEKGFYSGRIIRKGASLFVCIGSTIGKIGQAGADVITNQQINSLIPYERYDDNFIYSNLLKSSSKIKQLAATQALPIINKETFGSYFINLPQLDEQIKIGNFFNKLDQQIELEEKKLELLEQQKRGYMQDIFSLKLRFKDNNGNDYPEWEEKKLEDLADIVRGASPRPIKDSKWFDSTSEVGWLRISDVTNQNGKIYNLEQRLSLEGQLKTRVIASPHLLLSIAASVGKPVINFVKTGVHDGFLIFLNPKFNLIFMYNWLEMFKPKWQKYGQPGSQVNLNSELVKSQIITIPNYYEQQKIGDFFNKLDEIINNQSKKINTLKLRKQGFL